MMFIIGVIYSSLSPFYVGIWTLFVIVKKKNSTVLSGTSYYQILKVDRLVIYFTVPLSRNSEFYL